MPSKKPFRANSKVSSPKVLATAATGKQQTETPQPGKPLREVVTCPQCRGAHRLFYCEMFKGMTPKKCLELCIAKKLCKNCLLHNHTTEQCKLLRRCTICGDKHTKFLHVNDSNGQDESKSSVSTDLPGNMSNDDNVSSDISANVEKKVQSYNVSVKQTNNDLVSLPAVPILVNDTYVTYALIDTCSTQTFCSKALVEKLSIWGKKTTINLSTVENEDSSIQTDCVKLKVSSLDGSNTVWIDSALVTGYIPAPKVPTMNFLAYKHLNHIDPIPSDYTVDVLFGQDCPDIIKVLEIKVVLL